METIRRLWSSLKELVVCHLCLAVTFVTTGIIVDCIQALMYVLIRPFNPRLYRKLNYYVTYTLNSQMVFLVEWWSGSTCTMYSDPEHVKQFMGKEHAYLLLNHTYEVDWLLGWVICDRVRVLGNAKVYVKKVLQYAPVLGWSWKFQEIVFLDRNWEKDRRNLGKQLTRLLEYPDPFWLVLFPEGTRFTPEKHAASMKVAREKGLPELKHHLLPRTKGFVASIPYLKKNVPAIYDVIVAFDPKRGNDPTLFNMLSGKPVHACLLMRRIPIEEVPDDEIEAAAWLQRLYQQKDRLLDNYLNTGQFVPNNDEEDLKNFKTIELPRRYYSLINICSWTCIILFPLIWYLYLMLTSGSYLKMAIAITFVAGAYYGMIKLINLTRISKASNYGSSEASEKSGSESEHRNGAAHSIANGKQKVQ